MIPSDTALTADERSTLLGIARKSLESYAASGKRLPLDPANFTDNLQSPRGAFVTLWHDLQLRGCIGYTRAVGALVEAVRDNAINAGFRDPRFIPVTETEIPHLTIEISAMCPGEEPGSPFRRVENLEALELGKDGLYLEAIDQRHGGLLLPQVPIEHHWDLNQFLDALCRKAGAPPRSWENPNYRLYYFRAEVFKETA